MVCSNFSPIFDNQQIFADQMVTEIPKETIYEEVFIIRKRIKNTSTWSFELGRKIWNKAPYWGYIGFMNKNEKEADSNDI